MIIKKIKKVTGYWLNRCYKCLGKDFYTTDQDYLDGRGILLEETLKCKNCDAVVNHWAYGNWEAPIKFKDKIEVLWHIIKYDMTWKIVKFRQYVMNKTKWW